MPELYRIIKFKRNCGRCGGSLVQFQQGDAGTNALPFEIGKVLVMSDIRTDDVRGLHAHYETEEILVALSGGCIVDLDDGRGRKDTVHLSSSEVSDQKSEISNPTSDLRPPIFAVPNNQPLATSHCEEIKALLLFPHIWRVMRDFEPGTTLMVIANIKYDEADYIRDRVEFERLCHSW